MPATDGINLKAYPVPTKDDVTIAFEIAKKEHVTIQINNLLGQIAFMEEKNNFDGFYTKKVNLNTFSGGIYVLTVRVGSKLYTRKIILIK